MATIPTDLLRGDANRGNDTLSTLRAKARLLFGIKPEQPTTLAERINEADADYYDRFYG